MPENWGSISVGSVVTVPLTRIQVTDNHFRAVDRVCDLLDAFSTAPVSGYDSFLVGLTLPEPLGTYEGTVPPASAEEFQRFFRFGSFTLLAPRPGVPPLAPWGTHSTVVSGFVETEGVVPAPGSMLLCGTGLIALLRAVRRPPERNIAGPP